jgi:hypothetical protein
MMRPIRKTRPSKSESASGSSAIHAGMDAGKLAHALALRRAIEPDAADRARRIVDAASARLWLADGIPFTDAITMLEVRRRFELSPDHCRAHAVEVVWTAWRAISARKNSQISYREESHHAVA